MKKTSSGRNLEIREAHYQKYFGALSEPVMHSTDSKSVHIDIYQFGPGKHRDYWTLVTGGMSDEAQHVPADAPKHVSHRVELMMYASKPEGWMFSVLKGLGEMPFDDETYLHWHHTVPNGMPMTARRSALTAFFFLPPYFEREGFDSLRVEGTAVNILWMIPITEAERAYAERHGSEALEQIMVEKQLDPVVNERRTSLV